MVGGWPWWNSWKFRPSVDFGDSFSNVIAYFYGNGNNHKLVFTSSLRREVSYTCSSCVLMGLLFLETISAEFEVWI